MKEAEIIIVGAGASGLMAAIELGKAGKRVMILEARDRVGGRIWQLPEQEFGYKAQAGAEFVHGDAKVTKALIKEAGLTLTALDGEVWNVRGDKPTHTTGGPTDDPHFVIHQDLIKQKLNELKKDISIVEFLKTSFQDEKYASLCDWIIKLVESYDAADPNRISTFALREEWLGGEKWKQEKIKEGYGSLIDFLVSKAQKNNVEICLGQKVELVEIKNNNVQIGCINGEKYTAQKVVITSSLPTLSQINFSPSIPEKIAAASKIGFGAVIKILLKFKSKWWVNTLDSDLSKMIFMLTNEDVTAWWTQYPESHPVLTGWIPGPLALRLSKESPEKIINVALDSLSKTFKVSKDFLQNELIDSRVVNWPADPLAQGAYSYATPETKEAHAELIKPVNNRIFFAGEALYSGKETATVEGALASGKETAAKILALD